MKLKHIAFLLTVCAAIAGTNLGQAASTVLTCWSVHAVPLICSWFSKEYLQHCT